MMGSVNFWNVYIKRHLFRTRVWIILICRSFADDTFIFTLALAVYTKANENCTNTKMLMFNFKFFRYQFEMYGTRLPNLPLSNLIKSGEEIEEISNHYIIIGENIKCCIQIDKHIVSNGILRQTIFCFRKNQRITRPFLINLIDHYFSSHSKKLNKLSHATLFE